MVEISLSGSGGGHGRATSRGYPTSLEVLGFEYDRDALGRITEVRETVGGIETPRAFTYDSAGRLTDVSVGGFVAAHWAYDGNSNRVAATTALGTVTADYDEQDRLLRYGDAAFTYTANGELATRTDLGGTTSYTYDAVGNLRRVELSDGRFVEYVIDARNRRVGKKVDGVLVQGWLYRDQLEPVAELDGAGSVVSRFVYATKGHSPDYMIRDGSTYRIVSDHLGSPRLVIDVDSGAVVQRMDFDEWGLITLDTNPGWQPFGFAGGLLDADTGLTRFGARDYAAEFGRWTAKDPIRFAAGDYNIFGYVSSDPINGIDPSGMDMSSGMATRLCRATAVAAADGPQPGPGDVIGFCVLFPEICFPKIPPPNICKMGGDDDDPDECPEWPPKEEEDDCEAAFATCMLDKKQPAGNVPNFGATKDCPSCLRECKANGNQWPDYKCPRPGYIPPGGWDAPLR